MCFSIPKKIISLKGQRATLEDGSIADVSALGKIAPGDYIRTSGMIGTERLSPSEGIASRMAIKKSIDA